VFAALTLLGTASQVSIGFAQPVPRVMMIGLGAGMSCAEWVAEARQDEALEQWAFGFASAMAATAQAQGIVDPLASMDRTSIHEWLATYCRNRGDLPLSVALVRMIFGAGR
jgi:hypothetical protein